MKFQIVHWSSLYIRGPISFNNITDKMMIDKWQEIDLYNRFIFPYQISTFLTYQSYLTQYLNFYKLRILYTLLWFMNIFEMVIINVWKGVFIHIV